MHNACESHSAMRRRTDATSPDESVHIDTATEEHEFAEIWPSCPLAIDAYEISDLRDPRTVEVVKCLIDLSLERGRTEIVILNLEHLVQDDSGLTAIDRMYLVKRVIVGACHDLGLGTPRLQLARADGNLDLRVFVRRRRAELSNVVPFRPKVRVRASA